MLVETSAQFEGGRRRCAKYIEYSSGWQKIWVFLQLFCECVCTYVHGPSSLYVCFQSGCLPLGLTGAFHLCSFEFCAMQPDSDQMWCRGGRGCCCGDCGPEGRNGLGGWWGEGLWRGWQLCVLSGLVMVFSVYDCYATSHASGSALIELRNCYVCSTIFHTHKNTHTRKPELLPSENSRAVLIICVNVERQHSEPQTRVMRKLSRRLLIFSTKIWTSFERPYTYVYYLRYIQTYYQNRHGNNNSSEPMYVRFMLGFITLLFIVSFTFYSVFQAGIIFYARFNMYQLFPNWSNFEPFFYTFEYFPIVQCYWKRIESVKKLGKYLHG